mmetsp:Transcript_18744/g.39507  ORF Transcript_18744/g.39507 Transcript_18744/m.39507 type:complete len:99 (+) Transcript_18744:281-577(+)
MEQENRRRWEAIGGPWLLSGRGAGSGTGTGTGAGDFTRLSTTGIWLMKTLGDNDRSKKPSKGVGSMDAAGSKDALLDFENLTGAGDPGVSWDGELPRS